VPAYYSQFLWYYPVTETWIQFTISLLLDSSKSHAQTTILVLAFKQTFMVTVNTHTHAQRNGSLDDIVRFEVFTALSCGLLDVMLCSNVAEDKCSRGLYHLHL